MITPQQYKQLCTKDTVFKLISHKSKNENCLFACFNKANGVNVSKLKADNIRKELGTELFTQIDIDDVERITKYYHTHGYNKGVYLVNEHYTLSPTRTTLMIFL
eukprot:m.259424 g.259424  ORF g.259424 m.259424 type:complete len:104 (+) comp26772_c1_seq21:473-784(+)